MSEKKILIAVAGAMAFAAMSAPAAAGTKDDIRNLNERLLRIEQSVTAGTSATVRIGEMEREIQLLTGRIEELTFQLDQSNARLDAVSAALSGDPQFGGPLVPGAIERGGPRGPIDLTTGDPIADQIARETSAAQSSAASASDVALPLNPDAAFDYASAFLLHGDYPRAKDAFKLYVEAFPNHPRTPDAQFRLGEIHLALSENAEAADVFITHIRNYPNDPRAAEAYLKLGTAFSRLDRPTEACTVFKTMKTKFPNAARAVVDRANLEMARIDCQ